VCPTHVRINVKTSFEALPRKFVKENAIDTGKKTFFYIISGLGGLHALDFLRCAW